MTDLEKVTTLMVDGDVLIYKYAAGCQEHIDWGDGLWCSYANENRAWSHLKGFLDQLFKELGVDQIQIALSSPENFRKDLSPSYKSKRKQREPLLLYQVLRDCLKETYDVLEEPGLEADDLLGIYGTSPGLEGKVILATIDKDLLQVPGYHLHLDRISEGVYEVDKNQANLAFYAQVLSGDPVDTYPGCPGIGVKRAKRLLESGEDDERKMWKIILDAYEQAGLTEKEALLQARLARILRFKDYDFDQKKIHLWKPTQKHGR